MRIAFTHNNADCDGFASMIGLRGLYPGLRIVLGQRVAPRVKRLLALHREFVRPLSVHDLEPSKVELAVVADVARRSRLAEFEPIFTRHDDTGKPRLVVYDHHKSSPDDLRADASYVANVGATCTLVTEQLREASVTPSLIEATLLSIGIHTDTGSLTYTTGCARDARALTWLMECGANVRMVERFLRQTLTEGQRAALTHLLDRIRIIEVGGLPVAVTGVALERGVDGLASVVSQALRLTDVAAIFAVFHIRGRKAQLVARARAPELDAGAVMRSFGGGGHRAAAAATVRTEDPFALLASLTDRIRADAPQTATAGALMEGQIARLNGSATFGDALGMMDARGMDVLAVEREGRLVGTVDRTFIRAARRDDRMDASISSAMRHGLLTVAHDVALDPLAQHFMDEDQPVLFVERDGEIVGQVLRSRVLDRLYHRTKADSE